MRAVLDNQPGAARDIILLNAGAAIYIAGIAPDMKAGIDRAAEVIADGSARQKLDQLITLTNQLAGAG